MTKLPKWAEVAAKEWVTDRIEGNPLETKIHPEVAFLAGARIVLDRLKATEERDHVYSCSAEPYRSVQEVNEFNEGRASVRAEVFAEEEKRDE